jgi:hypothetical protein
MKTIDLAKESRDLYTATRKVKEVVADTGTFLAVDGQGEPGGEMFQAAVQQLYSVAFTVKFTLKQAGKLDFKVNKLECLYLSDPAKTSMKDWKWRLLLRIPEEVKAGAVTGARKILRERKELDASAVKRLRWKEGRCAQVLHVGPYDELGGVYQQLESYVSANGLKAAGPAHETYLSDPRRTAPAKLRTIVRLGVKKA